MLQLRPPRLFYSTFYCYDFTLLYFVTCDFWKTNKLDTWHLITTEVLVVIPLFLCSFDYKKILFCSSGWFLIYFVIYVLGFLSGMKFYLIHTHLRHQRKTLFRTFSKQKHLIAYSQILPKFPLTPSQLFKQKRNQPNGNLNTISSVAYKSCSDYVIYHNVMLAHLNRSRKRLLKLP